MHTTKYVAAAFGFAFVAAWAAFGFGDAILCLLGAAFAYAAAAVVQGEIDLGDLQQRARGADRPSGFGRGPRVR
jgi:4-hydroxybenzoate polyprenyltransferase